jgi:hypothetical protein
MTRIASASTAGNLSPAIARIPHVVDTNLLPSVPEGASFCRTHYRRGKIVLETGQFEFVPSCNGQKASPTGQSLIRRFASVPTLNSRVLDELLEFPDLIPRFLGSFVDKKRVCVVFLGTTFKGLSASGDCFHCLVRRDDGKYYGGIRWVEDRFGPNDVVAVLKSQKNVVQ